MIPLRLAEGSGGRIESIEFKNTSFSKPINKPLHDTSSQASEPQWVLITSLPLLDPLYRVDQHNNVQKQAVPDPEEQHYLHRDEQHQ